MLVIYIDGVGTFESTYRNRPIDLRINIQSNCMLCFDVIQVLMTKSSFIKVVLLVWKFIISPVRLTST